MKYLLTINKAHEIKDFANHFEAMKYVRTLDKKGWASLLDTFLIADIKKGITLIDPELVENL